MPSISSPMDLISFRINIFSSVLLSCIFFLVVSTATNISDGVFEFDSAQGYTPISRTLLQVTKRCNLNWEVLDYTVITEPCKGPRYSPEKCCTALRKFACPYAKEINDLGTDCAETMFRNITFRGHYPQGLFASECREGKDGLSCINFTSSDADVAPPFACYSFSPLLRLFIPGFFILLFVM